ncbi:MAG: polyphosphate polymerase domain-containing protein [Phycisphaerae bacterium]
MPDDRGRSNKWQRYEAKYLISEVQAAEIRRYCRDYLPADPHASRESGCRYPVLSIYLDSASRELLRQTIDKQANRFKLRARTYRRYDEPPDGATAFFEVKRRVDGIMEKTRVPVGPEQRDALLWNGRASFDHWGEAKDGGGPEVTEFFDLRARVGADPVLGIFYMREAYESASAERIRITLDRDLRYGLLARPGSGEQDMWWPVETGGVILEVKFTNSYPFWVANMLRRVEIMRRGVCKYAICSRAAGVCVENGASQRRRVP